MVQLNFNANEVDPSVGFEAVPEGKYLAVIVGSDEKSTKSGNGSYTQFEFEVVDGEYKGRKLWSRLNLNNPNTTAVAMARAELSAICRAVGVMVPRDSVELHNIPLYIDVKCVKRQDNGEMSNKIKGYESKSNPPIQGTPNTATEGKAPWG